MFQKNVKFFVGLSIIFSAFIFQSCSDSSTGPDTDTPNDSNTAYSHTKSPGSSAHDFLSNDTFTALQVEIDYMPGQKPTNEALNNLSKFLNKHLNKSDINIGPVTQIPGAQADTFSVNDAYQLEKKYRDAYVQDEQKLKAYFIILDGENANNDLVLGATYFNTSVAIFGKKINEISAGFGSPSKDKIESTVLEHEFGHLMGLVGNDTPLQSDHKTEGSAHCTTDGCLMNPKIESSNFWDNLFDGSIPQLDSLCVQDLRANGGK